MRVSDHDTYSSRYTQTSGQRISTKGRIAGAYFFKGELMWHRPVGSNAVSCSSRADTVIAFCCVHCSSDSQCFSKGRTTPKIVSCSWHLDRFSRFCRGHKREIQTHRHSDRPHYSVCSNRPHLAIAVMRPKNGQTAGTSITGLC